MAGGRMMDSLYLYNVYSNMLVTVEFQEFCQQQEHEVRVFNIRKKVSNFAFIRVIGAEFEFFRSVLLAFCSTKTVVGVVMRS
jgi:hypothetical protein